MLPSCTPHIRGVARRSLICVACRDALRDIEGTGRHHMFTRRQAIRWAELWLSCWNDADFDTLLAMHRDDTRFGVWDAGAGPRLDRKEAMKRHWGGGAVRASLSSSGVRRGGVGPRVAGDHGCLCRGLRGHAHAWLRPGAARCHRPRHRRRTVCRVHRGRRLSPLCSRTLANGLSARVQEDDDADQNSSNDTLD